MGGGARASAAPGEGWHAGRAPHGDHHRQLAEELAQLPRNRARLSPCRASRPAGRRPAQAGRSSRTTIARLQKLGWKEFYRGELARQIVADLRSRGSLITQDDWESYEARVRGAVARILSPVPRDHHAARDLRRRGAARDAEHPRTVRTGPRQSRLGRYLAPHDRGDGEGRLRPEALARRPRACRPSSPKH